VLGCWNNRRYCHNRKRTASILNFWIGKNNKKIEPAKYNCIQNFYNLWKGGGGNPEDYDSEQLLQSRSRRTLQLEDVAHTINPISGLDSEGLAYFMPRLVELMLDMDSKSKEGDCYLYWFVMQFSTGMLSAADGRLALFEKRHFRFLCKVLVEIEDCHGSYLAEECLE